MRDAKLSESDWQSGEALDLCEGELPVSDNASTQSFVSGLLSVFHQLALVAVYGFFVIKALLQFNPQWDFLAYHLPDALGRFHLTSYQPEPYLARMNQAFPPLAHLAQGFLVFLTGRMSTANGANALLFVGVLVLLRLLLRDRVSWRWFLTALLALPLFVFHFVSGYTDLFANLGILLAWAALRAQDRYYDRDDRSHVPRHLGAISLVLGTAIACLSKVQMWPAAAIVFLYSTAKLPRLAAIGAVPARIIWPTLVALLLVVAAWPVRNLVVYENPTYPVRFPLAPSFFPNYTRSEATDRDRPVAYRDDSAPALFATSVFELNRFSQGGFQWSLDQSAPEGEQSPHHRLGGWFLATVLLLGGCWFVALRRGVVHVGQARLFALLLLAVALTPQSHELRYWLFIPLISALTAGELLVSRSAVTYFFKGALLASALFVLLQTRPFTLDTRPVSSYAPAEAVSYWQQRAVNPADREQICGKLPWTIFWAGPSFNEFGVDACVNR